MDDDKKFEWITYYTEFADKLRPYIDDRATLIQKIKAVYTTLGSDSPALGRLPTLEKGNNIVDIDPFTVFGLFNKGIAQENRTAIMKVFAQKFEVKAEAPQNFSGIPVLDNRAATFYRFGDERGKHNIDVLWWLFIAALNYEKKPSAENKAEFVKYYDTAMHQKGIKWNLTMGLYWIRPYEYINLDSRNRWFLTSYEKNSPEIDQAIGKLDVVPSAAEYLNMIRVMKQAFAKGTTEYRDFPTLSYCAWKVSEQVNQEKRTASGHGNNETMKTVYLRWMKPLLKALIDLGGSATPKDACAKIAENESLSQEELEAVTGKSKVSKFPSS